MSTRIFSDPKRAELLAVIGLVVCLGCQALAAIQDKAPTCDEYAHHIANGYSYLLTGDFKMNPASPPLPRLLSALGVWFVHPKLPLEHDSFSRGDSLEFARQFFTVANHNLTEITTAARVPILILSIIFALLVYWWARVLFGATAGLAALALYVFCPDIIAHSSLATADLTVAFFFFLALASFWSYLKNPSLKKIMVVGVFTGCAFLSKFSAILLLPILLLIALLAGKGRLVALKRTGLFIVIAALTIWAGYFFEIKPLLGGTPDPVKKAAMYEKIGGPSFRAFAEKAPVPLSTFSSAFVSMMVTRAKGTNAYLMGEWSRQGWWYYYFVAFAIKNTIPCLILIFLGLFFIRKLGLDRVTACVLTVPVAIFFLATLRDKAQAGIRYFLPIYPLFFVMGAGAAAYLWKKKSIAVKLLILALLCWHAGEAIAICPDYLAYFNEFIGGPNNGYKYLRDSNIDWGQDLKALGSYVRENEIGEVRLYTLSPVEPSVYGIQARALSAGEFDRPERAFYAIGAHFIDSVRWARARRPDAVLHRTFFIYDLRQIADAGA